VFRSLLENTVSLPRTRPADLTSVFCRYFIRVIDYEDVNRNLLSDKPEPQLFLHGSKERRAIVRIALCPL